MPPLGSKFYIDYYIRPIGWDAVETEETLVLIFIAFLAAKIGGEIMERMKLPAVTGELMAGVILGPTIFNLITAEHSFFDVLAQLGATFLLFSVGMETKLSELKKVPVRPSMSPVVSGAS